METRRDYVDGGERREKLESKPVRLHSFWQESASRDSGFAPVQTDSAIYARSSANRITPAFFPSTPKRRVYSRFFSRSKLFSRK